MRFGDESPKRNFGRQPNVTPLQHLRQFAAFNHHARACADFRQNHAAHAVALGTSSAIVAASCARASGPRRARSADRKLSAPRSMARACALRGHAQASRPTLPPRPCRADRFAAAARRTPSCFPTHAPAYGRVQLHADTVVVRVFMHIARLDGQHRATISSSLGISAAREPSRSMVSNSALSAMQPYLMTSPSPAPTAARVQRSQRVAVDEHQLRLINAPSRFLPRG